MPPQSRNDPLKLWMKDDHGAPAIPVVRWESYEALDMRLRDQEADMRRTRMEFTPEKVREVAAGIVERHGKNLIDAMTEHNLFNKSDDFNPANIVALLELFYEALKVTSASEKPAINSARYERLRILGCAPGESKQLDAGTVLRFTNLDEYVDNDIRLHPSRGEAT